MDRMSELPEEMIHHILSFLSIEEAAKTSILSKTWLNSWSTYPTSDFYADDHHHNIDATHEDSFMEFVDASLLRYRKHNMRMKKFTLHIDNKIYDRKLVSRIDNWIETAIENQVEELDLQLVTKIWYTLPQKLFVSKSLVVLTLKDCELNKISDTNNTIIKFHSLKKLSLEYVQVDVCTIQSLISACPLIEEIDLSNCRNLNKIHVANNLHRLKIVKIIFYVNEPESVHIDAPSLEAFDICGSSELPWTTNVGSCRNLKHLHIECTNIGDHSLRDLISQLPLLEFLTLQFCNMLERINISSNSLREFNLINYEKVVEAKIDALNLVLFSYTGKSLPYLHSTSDSVVWKATIYLGSDLHLDAIFFSKLREFLTKSGHFIDMWLDISSLECTFNMEEELRKIPNALTCEVEDFTLNITSPSLSCLALLNGLFWICHPKTLALLCSETNKNFIKELTETLSNREDQNCCSSSHIKCWRHCLKDVEFDSLVGEDEGIENERVLSMDSWIEFRFNW